ncbi:MAG: thioredoxin family protein [Acidimicrobiia bacterium]|nr:thioredoxin family protein [Acidimicrobiia bacterium]
MAVFSRKTKPTKLQSLEELEPMLRSGKPVLLDFMQVGCSPCKVMDGIVNELAVEYGDSAHIVKVDVGKVPGAAQAFKVRSTPTFVLLGTAPAKQSKKARQRAAKQGGQPRNKSRAITPRWRTTGLVKKDALAGVLESNGAIRA